ncbi:hypothetical protein Ccrd_024507 [Cynara cardunculus var. scolymus]|uniref:Uncharacterized protein n=1 Tax=Cynara cardunculus var. scolymus TaxID=59895 RepID=A0A118JS64_CYNCS|nr:hypothetical protein Ccrd_024507 [Cynara cardunculus var. scolymus]
MGVINVYNGSSLCMIICNNGFSFSPSLDKASCAFPRNQRKFSCMASSRAAVKEEGKQQLTGDSFIRPHLRELSPYQPILPFEVIL